MKPEWQQIKKCGRFVVNFMNMNNVINNRTELKRVAMSTLVSLVILNPKLVRRELTLSAKFMET